MLLRFARGLLGLAFLALAPVHSSAAKPDLARFESRLAELVEKYGGASQGFVGELGAAGRLEALSAAGGESVPNRFLFWTDRQNAARSPQVVELLGLLGVNNTEIVPDLEGVVHAYVPADEEDSADDFEHWRNHVGRIPWLKNGEPVKVMRTAGLLQVYPGWNLDRVDQRKCVAVMSLRLPLGHR
jgi:hypothetical protein